MRMFILDFRFKSKRPQTHLFTHWRKTEDEAGAVDQDSFKTTHDDNTTHGALS
jgi:hypothetical protein